MFCDLETERLRLKCIGYDDTDFFYKQFTTDEVNRYLFDAEPCASPEEAREWIGYDEHRNHHRWALVLKNSGEKIGTCGFHCWNREKGTAEIGYDLQSDFRGCGYMAEALNAIITFAEIAMKLRAIYAHISVENADSAQTAGKAGFRKMGRHFFEDFRGGKYPHDIYEYRAKRRDNGVSSH